jgi:hypothetical protein
VFVFSNTVDLVVRHVCKKRRTLYRDKDDVVVEITNTEFWIRDEEKDKRDLDVRLNCKPDRRTSSISVSTGSQNIVCVVAHPTSTLFSFIAKSGRIASLATSMHL